MDPRRRRRLGDRLCRLSLGLSLGLRLRLGRRSVLGGGLALAASAAARAPPSLLLRLLLARRFRGRGLRLCGLLRRLLCLLGRLGGGLRLPRRRLARRFLGLGLGRDRALGLRGAADTGRVGGAVEDALDPDLHLLADQRGRVRDGDFQTVELPDARGRVVAAHLDELDLGVGALERRSLGP